MSFEVFCFVCICTVCLSGRWLTVLGQDSMLSCVHGIGGVGDGVCICGLVYYCWFLLCLLLHMAVGEPYWFCC